MRAIVLNDDDLVWIIGKLREDFDTPKEPHQYREYFDTIERAKRMGFKEESEMMESDIPYIKSDRP